MTIRDVAKRANVGIATVSRVLNGHPSVRPETRARVLAAIEQLDYIPNTAAQNLSSGQTRSIGVFVPHFTRPSSIQRLIGIQEVLNDSDYDLLLFSTNSLEKYYVQLRQVVRQHRVDGVLVISMAVPEEHRLLMERMDIPLVQIEVFSDYASSVGVDNTLGGQLATEYLLAQGHEQIAFLGDVRESPFGFSATNERFIGYRYALSEANLAMSDDYCSFSGISDHHKEEAIRQAHDLLALSPPPTAIFAASDQQAAGVLEAARQRALLVGDQLSVIGFGDLDIAHYLNLTTIRQPLAEVGRTGANVLLQHLRGERSIYQKRFNDLEVIERGTVKPVPCDDSTFF
ncbi:MAG: LacI family transcriptional regulator [Chloroflexi bacterium]|nr:LacI family transcriptional regulator [Chloroflexota bacterium]